MAQDRIVAVGFLTSVELAMLGERFERYFPVKDGNVFADLLEKLDRVEATPMATGVTIHMKLE
jgi:hypothetical protein